MIRLNDLMTVRSQISVSVGSVGGIVLLAGQKFPVLSFLDNKKNKRGV